MLCGLKSVMARSGSLAMNALVNGRATVLGTHTHLKRGLGNCAATSTDQLAAS